LRRIVRIAALFLAEPVLWAGLEWVRGWFLTGFAWNYLGTAVSQFPDFALAARFGGVYLVSAMVLSVNGVFATLIERIIARMLLKEEDDNNLSRCFIKVTRNLETLLPLLGVVALVYLGSRDAQINAPEKKLSIKASLIQRNAPSVFKSADTRENPYEVFGTLLTTCRYSKPDLVVWAESAMSEFGHLKHPRAYEAAKFVSENTGGAALLSGGDYIEFKENERLYYNGAAIYHSGPTGVEDVDIYAKRHLVPFGEYIPFDKWIKPLQKLSPIGVSLYPGNGTVVKLYVKRSDEKGVTNKVEVVLGPLICFEDTDSPLARDSARHGAQLLVLITNDSWFSHSAEAEQHAWQSVMRSIETGLPMIRVGNSGVTGSVSPKGVSNWLCDGNGKVLVDAKGSHTVSVDVPQNPKKTLYVRLGDFPLAALFFTVLSFIFFPLVKSRIIAKER
jgi:apolipoprotein N-acyltransferase